MDLMNAKALKSQTGQIHLNRKPKGRVYEKRVCPVPTCNKVVARIHNHLKATHQVKSENVYRKLLKEAVVYKELATQSESDSGDSSEREDDEYEQVKRILKTGGIGYLRNVQDVPVDTDDSSDEDWLAVKTCEVAEKNSGMFLIMLCHLLFVQLLSWYEVQGTMYEYLVIFIVIHSNIC